MPGEHVDAFVASVKRCLESTSFIKDFYERFLGTSVAVRDKFLDTNFDRQHQAMADSLYAMAVDAQGGPENLARLDMNRLTRRHKEMGIGAGMYDVWLDCLIQTAREHDPEFSDTLERTWRECLAPGIERMRSGASSRG